MRQQFNKDRHYTRRADRHIGHKQKHPVESGQDCYRQYIDAIHPRTATRRSAKAVRQPPRTDCRNDSFRMWIQITRHILPPFPQTIRPTPDRIPEQTQ